MFQEDMLLNSDIFYVTFNDAIVFALLIPEDVC